VKNFLTRSLCWLVMMFAFILWTFFWFRWEKNHVLIFVVFVPSAFFWSIPFYILFHHHGKERGRREVIENILREKGTREDDGEKFNLDDHLNYYHKDKVKEFKERGYL
jgi:hypothetical protein